MNRIADLKPIGPNRQRKTSVAGYQPLPVVASVAEIEDPGLIHKIGLYAGLGWLAIMASMVHELLAYLLHINTYLLYLVGPPAILCAILTAAIPRMLSSRAAKYWLFFAGLMAVSVPLSTWAGGSMLRLLDYVRYSLPLLFIPAGFALNWKETRKICSTIAWCGVFILISARLFAEADAGRLSLNSSATIGNSNDLAAHVVWVLPFIICSAMDKKQFFILRLFLFGSVGYGIWIVLGTASRGALIALVATVLFALMYATARQKMIVGAIAAILAISAPLVLPTATLVRLSSLITGQDIEAAQSKESRSYLFRQSVIYTMQHPVFGVGLDQFSNFEGLSSASAGLRGQWHATHCAFTEVSSECGVPAMIFFSLGIGSSLLSVRRTWKQARQNGFAEISNVCFCYMMSFIAFAVAIIFLANAYRFYLPVMVGLGVAISITGSRHMMANTAPKDILARQ